MNFIENLNKIILIQVSVDTIRKLIIHLHYCDNS